MTDRPDLSVVVPCHDEEERLASLEEGVRRLAARLGPLTAEIILVDDGSGDRTAERLAEIAERLEGELSDRVAPVVEGHRRDRGKGAALRTGVAVARGRWVLTADAENRSSPANLGRAPVIASVERLGTTLAFVYDLRGAGGS